MRFQIMTLPDIVDGGLAHSLASGHEPATPLRHAFGFAAERSIHNRLDLLRPVNRFATSPRRHFPQTIQTLLRKAGAPQGDGFAIDLQALSDGIVGLLTPVKNGAIMAGVGRCQGSTRARWQGRSTNSK